MTKTQISTIMPPQGKESAGYDSLYSSLSKYILESPVSFPVRSKFSQEVFSRKKGVHTMNNSDSLLLKQRIFPSIEKQVLTWNELFPGIGDVDKHTLERPIPEKTIQVCFPRMSFLAEGGAQIYAILRIKEVLAKLCRESGMPLHDDCDFFHPDTLKKEEGNIKDFERPFDYQGKSNLIVTSVQFWLLHQEGNRFPTNQIPMSVSHASALLCIVQGGPRKLWEGCNQDHWFSCPGSPAGSGGIPCFDFFQEALCLTPLGYLEKPREIGGAASLFIN
ncbi:MAG: hypothetical protein IPJ67_02730 [Candidatus Moraniibacteriota bacterium]|nr:MAG: hypothetical protein IPJ67_02730 [Candidatus Moranbacteria bacterium]